MDSLRSFIRFVNRLNDQMGKIVSILIYPMIFILLFEVVMRYVFNRPTIWASELSGLLYGSYFLLGGAYAARWDAHIIIDFVYQRFSRRTKAIVDLITWTYFYLFCGVLLYKGAGYAWAATIHLERSNSPWEPYTWPVTLFIPLGALLMLLQGLTKTFQDFIMAFTGNELLPKADGHSGGEQPS